MTTLDAPRILGLDLSITATGWAINQTRWSTYEPRALGDLRLPSIRDAVRAICQREEIRVALIEGPVLRSQAAIALAMLHGTIRTELMDLEIPYVVIPPATLKKYATGKGNATKPDMAVAAYKRGEREFGDDNQCDAWWLTVMGLDALGHAPIPMPAAQREVLNKIVWPTLDERVA